VNLLLNGIFVKLACQITSLQIRSTVSSAGKKECFGSIPVVGKRHKGIRYEISLSDSGNSQGSPKSDYC
jgi:hypothetical protein